MRRRLIGRCLGCLLCAGCLWGGWQRCASDVRPEDQAIHHISYPYQASPARILDIQRGRSLIQVGSSREQVEERLGQPDETRPLFEPRMFRPERIGTTYWYFTSKTRADDLPTTTFIRITIDLNGSVVAIDTFGPDVNP